MCPSAAVPSRLWALLSQEKLLATIVLLHGLKLSCTVSTCPAGNLAINWLPYNSPLTKPYFDSIWYGLHLDCYAKLQNYQFAALHQVY
jgi:hypothetical protein